MLPAGIGVGIATWNGSNEGRTHAIARSAFRLPGAESREIKPLLSRCWISNVSGMDAWRLHAATETIVPLCADFTMASNTAMPCST